jgi:hypothetical protein
MLLKVPEHTEMSGKELYDFFHFPFLLLGLSNEIEQRKQEDPYQVNQVPV